MCVQRFDDSLNSAIRITYRISLRSSSMPEPRDPLLKVLTYCIGTQTTLTLKSLRSLWRARTSRLAAGARRPTKATIVNNNSGWEIYPKRARTL
jgi:hypothetical protein